MATAYDIKALTVLCAKGAEEKVFPGAAFAVGGKDWAEFGSVGRHCYAPCDQDAAVSPDTIWDLASVTKVVATTTAAMLAVDDGLISITDPVKRFLPEYAAKGRDAVTIRDLLLHQSGLPAYKNFTDKTLGAARVRGDILNQKFAYETAAKCEYSCLGFVTLQTIVELLYKRPMMELLRARVWGPLGMSSTDFCPPAEWRDRIAPTEKEADWRDAHRRSDLPRREYMQGEVHDPIAYLLDGKSGNAGLFSSARDLATFCQLLLNGGANKSGQVLCSKTIDDWTKKHSTLETRAYGWDTKSEVGSSAGSLFSPTSFGHTGYTGTTVWIDPVRQFFAVLLTNRVHPDDKSLAIKEFRPKFHDQAIKSLSA